MSKPFHLLAIILVVAIVSFTLGRKFPVHPQAAPLVEKTSVASEGEGAAFQRFRLARKNLYKPQAESQPFVEVSVENPIDRLPDRTRKFISEVSAADAEGYKPLFHQLGLSDEQTAEALERIEKAHAMANLAQTALGRVFKLEVLNKVLVQRVLQSARAMNKTPRLKLDEPLFQRLKKLTGLRKFR